MAARREGFWIGWLLLASVAGCPDQPPPVVVEPCELDEECVPEVRDPCARYFCDRTRTPPACNEALRPECIDVEDAPELDVPELDSPELDVPELDVPELDAPDIDTGGGTGVIACPPPPVDVVDPRPDPPGVFDPIATLCGIRGAGCFLTTVTVGSLPPDPAECPGSAGGLSHATSATGEPTLRPFGPWSLVAADVRVAPGLGDARLRTTGSSTVVVQHTDGDRFTVVLDARPGAALWRSVAPYAAPAPHLGEAFACLGEPHDFVTIVPSATGDVLVRVCDERGRFGICTVHGDVEGSPEAEGCDAYALELGYLTGPPRAPFVRTVVGPSYRIETTSHGTLGGSGRSLTGVPEDTDVTFTADNGTHRLDVVARWTAGRVTASVVAR